MERNVFSVIFEIDSAQVCRIAFPLCRGARGAQQLGVGGANTVSALIFYIMAAGYTLLHCEVMQRASQPASQRERWKQ
jgi:hypothetical protein